MVWLKGWTKSTDTFSYEFSLVMNALSHFDHIFSHVNPHVHKPRDSNKLSICFRWVACCRNRNKYKLSKKNIKNHRTVKICSNMESNINSRVFLTYIKHRYLKRKCTFRCIRNYITLTEESLTPLIYCMYQEVAHKRL